MERWEKYWPYEQITINDNQQKYISKNIKERCIAFIDILGFKEMVSTDIDKVIFTLRYFKFLSDSFFKIPLNYRGLNDEYQNRPIATMFSDSIVISQELNDTFSFADFISAIAEIQFQLLREGILIRGGIDIGMVYHDKSFIFGEGMISAYLLESHISNYPRITISDKALKRINKLTDEKFESQFNTYTCYDRQKVMYPSNNIEDFFGIEDFEYVSSDEFQISFIDYLRHGFHMLKSSQDDKYLELELESLYDFEIDTLSKIRSLISDGLRNNNFQVQVKYRWFRNYYNKNISIILKSYKEQLSEKEFQNLGKKLYI